MNVKVYQIDIDTQMKVDPEEWEKTLSDEENFVGAEQYNLVYTGTALANNLRELLLGSDSEREICVQGNPGIGMVKDVQFISEFLPYFNMSRQIYISDVIEVIDSDEDEPGFYYINDCDEETGHFSVKRVHFKSEDATISSWTCRGILYGGPEENGIEVITPRGKWEIGNLLFYEPGTLYLHEDNGVFYAEEGLQNPIMAVFYRIGNDVLENREVICVNGEWQFQKRESVAEDSSEEPEGEDDSDEYDDDCDDEYLPEDYFECEYGNDTVKCICYKERDPENPRSYIDKHRLLYGNIFICGVNFEDGYPESLTDEEMERAKKLVISISEKSLF